MTTKDEQRDALWAAVIAADDALYEASERKREAKVAYKAAHKAFDDYNEANRLAPFCAAVVRPSWGGEHRCTRYKGHGRDGLYCRQHAEKYPGEGEA